MQSKNHSHQGTQSKQSNGHANGHAVVLEESAPADPREAQAAEAITSLAHIKEEFAADKPLSPRDRRYASKFLRINASFIQQAGLAAKQQKLTSFDSATVQDTLAFESVVRPLISEMRGVLRSLEDTLWSRHQYAAEQALAVYASMKGLVRFTHDQASQQQLLELMQLIAPPRKPKAKSTETAPAASPPVASNATSSDAVPPAK